MFLTSQPSPGAIDAFLRAQRDAGFSYRELGATRSGLPSGYNIDRHRIRLGHGERSFTRAAAGIRDWRMFQLGWVSALPRDTPIQAGATVAILVRALGLWSLNACRIVYAIEDEGGIRRFGFAYGTLTDHAESGEERFSVEWHRADDAVWYDILAFSRPAHWLARIGYPLSRRLQRRFARDSMQVMAAIAA